MRYMCCNDVTQGWVASNTPTMRFLLPADLLTCALHTRWHTRAAMA